MPLDIFVEIVGHLEPLDLLHLARSNKFLRALLMNKANKILWKSARATIEDLPDCPPDLSEPAYASLVFESICTVCGSTRASKIDWSTRVRACKKHVPDATIPPNLMFLMLDRNQDEYVVVKSLVPSNLAMTYFRRTEALAIIAEYKAVKSKGDPAALEKYIEERKAQIQVISQHAVAIERWKLNRGVERSQKNKEMIAQRRNSIFQKLQELGWDEKDLHSEGRAVELEWNRMLEQPAALTNMIWNRIRPRLEAILQVRKEKRLVQEKQARKNLRRREVDNLMTTMASDSAARGENGKFSRYHWVFAFPALEDLYDLPSVKPFIEADETSVTIDAWTEKEQDIKHDVKIHQMKVRRLLVRKLLDTNSSTQAAQGSQHGEPYDLGTLANFDLQRLEAEDEANKEALAHPAAIFLTPSFRSVGYGQVERQAPVLRTYPAILTNVLGQAATASECLVSITVSATLRDTSKALASLLGEEEISEIIRNAPLNQDLFRCDACLAGMSSPMSWSQLVGHYLDEKQWFEIAHTKQIELQSLVAAGSTLPSSPSAPVGVVDDHTPMRASIISPEERERMLDAKAHADQLDDSDPWWTCKHCSNRSVHDTNPSRKRTKKREVLLHVRAKHGIAEDEAENHISEIRPPGLGWFGFYNDLYDPYDHFDPHDPFDPYDSYDPYEDEFGYDYDSFDDHDEGLYGQGHPYAQSEAEDSDGSLLPTGPSIPFDFVAMLAGGLPY
ncbi:hypothetical protein BS47DRAFT_1344467 [Hydnum rufescens UP504]|uniref:F-box domain-containing protein n=1 Tax=Hydnum rufescens UP504 TaxID=1448309 RepID=A0A9P6AYR6_9AGAM|nr:hypothetical protein BS47DRAFT_1344467 [Hydnum rufescens UP504]